MVNKELYKFYLLDVLYKDIEYYEKRYTFIAQMPFEVRNALRDVLITWKQLSNEDIDIDECMNEKIDFVTEWINYIVDNLDYVA